MATCTSLCGLQLPDFVVQCILRRETLYVSTHFVLERRGARSGTLLPFKQLAISVQRNDSRGLWNHPH